MDEIKNVIYRFLLRHPASFSFLRRCTDLFLDPRIADMPDRKILVRDVLPAFGSLGGDQLWIGVRHYTKDYPAVLESGGATCWTIDIDPSVALYGHPARHSTLDLFEATAAFSSRMFDAVLCNGVFGFGVNSDEDQTRAFQVMASLIKPGGWLLLGWNTDRIQDPLSKGLPIPWFEPASLPGLWQRHDVACSSHVFDVLRRRRS